MKISVRLASGFGLLILLFVLCTGISIHALWQARDGMNDTVNNKMKRYTLVLDMRGGLRDMAIAVRNLSAAERPGADAARMAAAGFTARKLRPAA